jgi:hypothetical protein
MRLFTIVSDEEKNTSEKGTICQHEVLFAGTRIRWQVDFFRFMLEVVWIIRINPGRRTLAGFFVRDFTKISIDFLQTFSTKTMLHFTNSTPTSTH